ncbi:hypothetical protein FRC04_001883 [Tulasnella sp. 424]|nr:hypothetical protein FRC04_001883 [Tulasnella sp. 424]KAG8977662.1 hypothetical protein FRC05_000918 [Tulasnella sp. 425]
MAPVPGAAEVPVGAVVEIQAGKGIVRYNGTTKFAPGRWIGVELSEPKGKNDGSVEGEVYFTCKPKHGMFIRATLIKSIEIPPSLGASTSRTSNPMSPPSPGPTRPGHRPNGSSSGLMSPPSLSRQSSARSAESSRPASPQKPTTSSTSTVPRPRLIPPTPLKRSTIPASPSPSGSRTPLTPTAARPSVQQQLAQLPSRKYSLSTSINVQPPPTSGPSLELNSPVAEKLPSLTSSPHLNAASPASTQSELPPPEQPPETAPARPPPQDDSHELRVKLRVLETKRADDARKIRELEGQLKDVHTFTAQRPIFQNTIQTLRNENTALKANVSDQAKQITSLEKKLEDHSEQLEMLMLDKEMAEERAEVAEAELEAEKESKAELEVELEVWRKGANAAEGGEGDGEGNAGRSEMAFRQLEKQNERLKDALLRMRDLTHETDAEQRRKIADLERELAGVDEMQANYDQTLARLEHADMQVEDLKQQLDDAMGAEEVLVQLTERNLLMSEKIEEMRIAIEDLEALRELNDELEETHIETERALQEEIEQKEAETRELSRKLELLQEGLQDYELTIQQFRDLVNSLQTELDGLREQDQTRQTESEAQASQSAALLSLNMRLQSSAVKNQARTIDLELKKLDALQAREMLNIVQPYLPQAYLETDSDSTGCYMYFQRIAFKMDLINTTVASQHGLPESLNGTITEKVVGVCDMRGRIAHLATLCKRFAAVLRRSDPETFLSAGKIYPEISPVEKRVDMHIDLLRREEFRELECVSDVAKMLAQFEHLSDTYFVKADLDVGERELDFASQIDYDLDTFFATLGLAKSSLESAINDDDIAIDSGDLDIRATLFEPLQKLLDCAKAPRTTSKKVLKRMEELVTASSAVTTDIVPQWMNTVDHVGKLVGFGIPLAQAIATYMTDVRGQKHSFQLSAVLSLIRQTVYDNFGNRGQPWSLVEEAIGTISQDLNSLTDFVMEAGNVIRVSAQAPWVTRVEDIRAITAVNLDAERAVAKLNEEILMLVKGVKTRDQTIQEGAAKIELMERRMETVKQQADAIIELESQLAKANQVAQDHSEALDTVQTDLEAMEKECDRLRQELASAPEKSAAGNQQNQAETLDLEGNYETSYLLKQIESLRGTIRFLRSENSYLKGQDLLREIYALPDLPEYIPPTPPLSPSLSPSPPSSPDIDSKPTLRSLATETKVLHREVMHYASSIRVIDLSNLNAKKGKGWVPQRLTPIGQLWEQRAEGEKLARRVKGLMERTGNLAVS